MTAARSDGASATTGVGLVAAAAAAAGAFAPLVAARPRNAIKAVCDLAVACSRP